MDKSQAICKRKKLKLEGFGFKIGNFYDGGYLSESENIVNMN